MSDQIYGNTLSNYLNAAAFAQPAAGAYGDFPRNGVEGPGFWTVDVALSAVSSLDTSAS